jgi:hypothetical protein
MSKHKSILSSLTALGASELPVTSNSVPRNSVLASVAAAGVSLLACQSAEAGTIDVFTPNANIGFAAGDVADFKFNLASLTPDGLELLRTAGTVRSLFFRGTPSANNSNVDFRTSGGYLAAPGAYGKKFSQVGTATATTSPALFLAGVSAGGFTGGADFSQEYLAFYFKDAFPQKHYGWIYGTLTGAFSNLNYNVISYAYDTTPNEQITMGQTQVSSSTPEPSTAALGAMATLILGAAGVRKWNKAKE